jgi:uncharacterized membrane protein
MRKKLFYILFALLVFGNSIIIGHCEEPYTPSDLEFTVTSEGNVLVDYTVETDPTKLSIEIDLFGEIYQDLYTFDQEGIPLTYTWTASGVEVDTLGSTSAVLSYLTPSLTNKVGAIWSLNITIPISSRIILPDGATIIDLSSIPLEIVTQEGRTSVIMQPGETYVYYTIDLLDIEILTEQKITEASIAIDEGKSLGWILTGAESKLQQAQNLFDQRLFEDAYNMAEQAILTAEEIMFKAGEAEVAIQTVENAIQFAEDNGRTNGLDTAKNLLQNAKGKLGSGDYVGAVDLANQALQSALEAEKPESSNLFIYGGAFLLMAAIAAAYYYFKVREVPPQVVPTSRPVDLDELFDMHPDLRVDDKMVIRFIAERGGEAFANEIRERFDIPRTSAWRLIRRLQRLEIVDERKIGGQSLVMIKEEYRK